VTPTGATAIAGRAERQPANAYALSVSGWPQQETGSVHEQAPVSPHELTTAISSPQLSHL
jgi:hypothetical protein